MRSRDNEVMWQEVVTTRHRRWLTPSKDQECSHVFLLWKNDSSEKKTEVKSLNQEPEVTCRHQVVEKDEVSSAPSLKIHHD